ncbi:MAG: hypothetical protein JSC085_000278 [Candidatus Tokpelaia sp. JSC085]|nr:MAG: hypothetical protein JSC085_000278 [Candidatus Tokpelaia sp. JSC085]
MQPSESQLSVQMVSGRTAIIAGSGLLPLAIATVMRDQGHDPFLVILRGKVDQRLYRFDHCEISIVEFAQLIRALKAAKVKNIVLAGGVTRPQWQHLKIDYPTIMAFPRICFALGKGDDALLRVFIRLVEKYGFHVVGAHEIVPGLLAPKGVKLTGKCPDKHERHNIALAAEAARRLGELDIGQGAIAVHGRVVALEGAEGTDNMLKRITRMRQDELIPQKGGVLVKLMKPGQDERADLPTIGPHTVENAYRARLVGIAVEAKHSFILNIEQTVNKANQYGMFIETL